MTMYKTHHPRACKVRFYQPREEGGGRLLSVEQCAQEDEMSIAEYLRNSKEEMLRRVVDERIIKAEGLADDFKKLVHEQRLSKWKEKALHGQYLREVEQVASKKDTFQWIKSGHLKRETEGFLIAAQDQALRANAIKVKIDKQGGSPLCRLCGVKDETVDHLVSRCSKIVQTD